MPPKSKKEAEEQARRQEQQRKKRQEQAARLEIERKKYMPETIPTGLLLLVSAQLITDFPNKSEQFVTDKLKQALKQTYPDTLTSPKLSFILKQLHYYIKDSLTLFGEMLSDQNFFKQRIFIAILMNLLHNTISLEKQANINRAQDEKIAKQLVTVHCNPCESYSPLSKQDGLTILNYIKQRHFSRYLLMKFFDKFPKRSTQFQLPLYIETPSLYYNTEQTTWIDLSQQKPQQKVS